MAFFGRTGKGRSLFLVSVLDGARQEEAAHPARRGAGARASSATGSTLLLAALREGVSDIWKVDLDTGAVTNLTQDEYADNNPQVSPDGKLVVYERRISGHGKIYAFPLADPSRKTQLTFGPFDDQAPYFSTDGTKLYYSSDEDDDIPNLRSLDLQTGGDRAVHRRLRRHDGARRRCTRRAATGSPSSRTTRASTSCTRRTPRSR